MANMFPKAYSTIVVSTVVNGCSCKN